MQVVFATTVAALMVWLGNAAASLSYLGVSAVAFARGDLSTIIDLAAIAAIFGAFLAYNRIKTALTASEAAAKAWHEECDAAKTRAERLEDQMKEVEKERLALVAKVTVLEQRPDLAKLEAAIVGMTEATTGQISVLTEATLTHETNAEKRSERIVSAIKELTI